MATESLSELQSAFSEWRRKKKNPKGRIPDALLARARRAVGVYGVGPVAYRLRVGPARLTGVVACSALLTAPTPTFTRVEIAAPVHVMQPLAEVETPAGVKLRVFQITPETTGLLASFCRAGGAI